MLNVAAHNHFSNLVVFVWERDCTKEKNQLKDRIMGELDHELIA